MTPHMQTDKPAKNKMWDLFIYLFLKLMLQADNFTRATSRARRLS